MLRLFSVVLMVYLFFLSCAPDARGNPGNDKENHNVPELGIIRKVDNGVKSVIGSGFAIKEKNNFKLFTAQHVALKEAGTQLEFCSTKMNCINLDQFAGVGPVLGTSIEHDWVYWEVNSLPLGTKALKVGPAPKMKDKVCAYGNPIGRIGEISCGAITNKKDYLLFTDVRILPGNSGGPLVDSKGRVVGIVSSIDQHHGQFIPNSSVVISFRSVWH